VGAKFTLSPQLAHGQTGVDILAKKGRQTFHIDVIGFKSNPSMRAKDFFEVFFRAVSRLNNGATRCVIALPRRFEAGLPARAGHHAVAWNRIAASFPELEIWLVDTGVNKFARTKWGAWVGGAPAPLRWLP
jgi:hypothetical protein